MAEPEAGAAESVQPELAGAGRRRRNRRWRSIGATAAVVVAALAALTVLFNALSTRFVPGNSDGATVVLEGASMSAGNLALHGWAISLDSFWTLDVLFYALVIRIGGLRPDLLNLVPALIAATVVVLGAALAREGRSGTAGIVAVATVVALVALASPDLAYFLLQGPWHIGTTLAALAAFATLARPGSGWRWLAGVVLLAAGVLGDVMIVTFGLVPLIVSGVAAMLRCRNWRAGMWTILAAPAGAALALGTRVVAQAIGTFTLVNRNVPIRYHQLVENLGNLANRLPGLFGVGTIPQTVPDGALGFQVARVAGLAAVLAAVLVGIARLLAGAALGRAPAGPAGSWRLDDLLVTGIVADIVTFVWGAGSNNTDYAKYLTPAILLGAVLAGRYAGRLAQRVVPARHGLTPAPAAAAPIQAGESPLLPRRAHAAARGIRRGYSPAARILLAGSVVLAGVYAAQVGVELAGPVAAQPARQLSAFLVAHHLDRGVGDYWSSTIVTVESSGEVAVRPVTTAPDGGLRRYERQSPESWYSGQRFDFFVYDLAKPWRNVNYRTAVATWGAPAREYPVGTYRVLVWSKPFTVSTALPAYGSPLQIFWSPGAPRSSTTTTTIPHSKVSPRRR